MALIDLQIPIAEEAIRGLHVGDQVRLYGVMVTGRDTAHKYIVDNFIRPLGARSGDRPQQGGDRPQQGGDRPQQGEDRPQQGEDRPQQGEDRPQQGGDRPQQGEDRPQQGEDRLQQGGDRARRGYEAIPESERALYSELRRLWQGGVLYHCGPVVSRDADGRWHFVSAGPTTSIREEPYEADVIAHFGLRGVIGKGGMGPKTLAACQKYGAVYLHAVGGAATLIGATVKEVLAVYKREEFGVPEAFWVVRVEGFPAVVTMDAHGQSLHEQIAAASAQKLAALIGN